MKRESMKSGMDKLKEQLFMRFFDGDDTMDDGNFIKKLLRALDDETVREKIWEIGKSGTYEKPLPEKRLSKTEGNDEKYLKLLKKLENEGFDSSEYAGPAEWISSLKREMEDLESKLQQINAQCLEKKQEVKQLRQDLYDAKRDRDRLSSENIRLKEDNRNMQERIDLLQDRCGGLSSLRDELKRQQEKNRSLETEINKKTQLLRSRFNEGYQCFLAFQRLDEDCREDLSGVIRHEDDFESFVCCLAQKAAMEKLWDEMFTCFMDKRKNCVDILNSIFDYSMSLTNKTLSNPYFKRLSVQAGEPYDTDLHRTAPDSPNQGIVRTVYLDGFENSYSGEIIRKSFVSL